MSRSEELVPHLPLAMPDAIPGLRWKASPAFHSSTSAAHEQEAPHFFERSRHLANHRRPLRP